jgi:PAS domain S-box-containing protein
MAAGTILLLIWMNARCRRRVEQSNARWRRSENEMRRTLEALHKTETKFEEITGLHKDLTEQKKADDEIRQLNQQLEQRVKERTAELAASEARLRTLVENAPEAIVVFDGATGRFMVCNENAIRLYGVPREELTRLGPADVSPPTQPDGRTSTQAARAWIDKALAGGTPVFEWMHRHASGRLIPCEVRLVQLPGDGAKLVRGSVIDNTERRRREAIQRAVYQISEAVHTADELDDLYHSIHQTIQGLMPARNFYLALHDPTTDRHYYAYHVDETDPKPAPRKMTTGLNGYVLRTGKALLADRGSMVNPQSEWRSQGGTPSAIWLGVPLTVRGHTIGVMAVQDYHDERAYGEEEKRILTFVAEQIALAIERKRAEQAMRESEEKHRALFEASSQGVMLHDEEKFIEVNPAVVRILGFNRAEEIVGKHPADLAAPIQPGGERADVLAPKHIQDCMAHGSARFEWLCRNTRGQEVPIEVILTRIPMGGRQIIQAVINDISERKRAEAELLRALAHEKELAALKTNFVSTVSHEFRTPLGIIMSSAQILDSYFERLEPDERKSHLASIQKSVRQMASLMEEVLLLGQVEAGKMEFKPLPLDLAKFCRRMVDEVHSATNRHCPVVLTAEDLPASAMADERLLRHILTNLLSNAVKYSEPEGTVQMSVRRDEADAIFEIVDQGIGIPEADLGWLFQAFHRGRNVGHRPGTGLGLVIVKRCVELHGGSIRLNSTPGCGTTVVVRIPVFAGFGNGGELRVEN